MGWERQSPTWASRGKKLPSQLRVKNSPISAPRVKKSYLDFTWKKSHFSASREESHISGTLRFY